jgi:hypothetical protein
MIKRTFAPPEERLAKLIARMKLMPAVLAEARKNLTAAPKIYTEIAIEQIDGNASLFSGAVTEAFADVKDQTLQSQFKSTRDEVLAALSSYKTWLQKDLLPRSTSEFAYGADTYRNGSGPTR